MMRLDPTAPARYPAGLEEPELLAEDLREFFRDLR